MTTAKEIMSTDFPRWTEIADVLDGPEQECYPAKEFTGRYYCRGAAGPNGHCDDQPMTIQCSHCIWVENELRENPGHPANVYIKRWEP